MISQNAVHLPAAYDLAGDSVIDEGFAGPDRQFVIKRDDQAGGDIVSGQRLFQRAIVVIARAAGEEPAELRTGVGDSFGPGISRQNPKAGGVALFGLELQRMVGGVPDHGRGIRAHADVLGKGA